MKQCKIFILFNVLFIHPLNVITIGSEHEQILKWWNEASKQKPLKCKNNPFYTEPMHSITMNLTNSWKFVKLIDSRPCTKADTGKIYFVHQFKGEQINHRFEGMSVIIQKEWMILFTIRVKIVKLLNSITLI